MKYVSIYASVTMYIETEHVYKYEYNLHIYMYNI